MNEWMNEWLNANCQVGCKWSKLYACDGGGKNQNPESKIIRICSDYIFFAIYIYIHTSITYISIYDIIDEWLYCNIHLKYNVALL